TRDWWESERRQFELFASIITEQELAEGKYRNQIHCLRFVRRLKYLPTNARFRELTLELIEKHVVPETKPGDAAQLAIALVHKIDYLLTWNYAHLANPVTQARGEKLVATR